MTRNNLAAQKYGTMDLQSRTEKASPHQLIQMLIDGAIVRIKAATGHMERKETTKKAELIGKAIAIIDGLRSSLDMEKGGNLSTNLDDLYVYMNRRLLQANIEDNAGYLAEVCSLLEEIKSAWDSIEAEQPAAVATSSSADSQHAAIAP